MVDDLDALKKKVTELEKKILVGFVWALGAIVTVTSDSVATPAGYKVLIELKGKGMQVYRCQANNTYMVVDANASLYDVNDYSFLNKKGQHYYLPNLDGQGGRPTWSYFDAQHNPASTVTGKVIERKEQQGTIPDVLLQATSHSGPVDFDKISYISRTQGIGGSPPTSCNTVGQIIAVDYEASYRFYVLENSGNWSLPSLLSIPQGHGLVASYFGEGKHTYSFNGSAWVLYNISAQLSSVPGQEVIGKHYLLEKPDYSGGQYTWETSMPPTSLTARIQNQVIVDPNGAPWHSLEATTHKGGQ
ncbi:uncharacterized protein LOC131029269 [Cryptomeria japonica]|uniref:uncharacterized protein LOC131029269 n=1 Tax=Cryptomeria japonica TaxID=3369 RepID=UPI0025AC1110|nr:uncharacterized protein LOC131029269 [Cryptomeria japonica]